VPSTSQSSGHSHIEQAEVLIALRSFEVVLMTDTVKKSFILNKPNIGLHIPTGIWES
jgi:hypothetical protein